MNNKGRVEYVAMVAPLKVAPDLQKSKFQAVNAEARRTEATQARQIRDLANQRTKLETAVAKQQPAVTTPAQPGTPAQTKSIKLDVPKTAITPRSGKGRKKAPPPLPVKSTNTNVNPGAKIESPKPVGNPPSLPHRPRLSP